MKYYISNYTRASILLVSSITNIVLTLITFILVPNITNGISKVKNYNVFYKQGLSDLTNCTAYGYAEFQYFYHPSNLLISQILLIWILIMQLSSFPVILLTYFKSSNRYIRLQKINVKTIKIILIIVCSLQLLLSGVILGKLESFVINFNKLSCTSSNILSYKNTFNSGIIISIMQFSITVVMCITVYFFIESDQNNQTPKKEPLQREDIVVLSTPKSKFSQKFDLGQYQFEKEYNERKIIEAIKFVTGIQKSYYCFPSSNYKSRKKIETNRLDYNLVQKLQKNKINGLNDSSFNSRSSSKKSILSELQFELNRQQIFNGLYNQDNVDIRKWDSNPLYEISIIKQCNTKLNQPFIDGI